MLTDFSDEFIKRIYELIYRFMEGLPEKANQSGISTGGNDLLQPIGRAPFCIKTQVALEVVDKPGEIYDKDFRCLVERAFRTMKTGHLELHPVNVRLADHTRAHVFVAMLAYKITRKLEKCWNTLNTSVMDGIAELNTLCSTEIQIKGEPRNIVIPVPRDSIKQLVELAKVVFPKSVPSKGIKVSSRKKLQDQRKC